MSSSHKYIIGCVAALFAIFLILSCTNTGDDGNADNAEARKIEENKMVEYINKICRTKPDEALDLLDKAELTHKMRTVKINLLKVMIYTNAYYDLNKALDYALKAYNDPSIKNDTLPRITITRTLSTIHYAMSNFSQACAMASEGSELAYGIGDQETLAYFYQYIGFSKYELGDHEDGFQYINRSINLYKKIIEKTPHWTFYSDLIFVMMKEIQYLDNDGRHSDALAKTGPCAEVIRQMTSLPDLPEGLVDKLTADYFSIACRTFYYTGNKARAEESYRKMLATEYVKSDLGQNTPALYEVVCGRYKEALARTEKADALYRQKDTVNTLFIDEVLSNGLAACKGLGYHERANFYLQRILNLKDSLNLRNQRQTALELAEIYETRDKDIQLIEKEAELKRNRLFLIMAAIIIVISIAAIVRITIYYRIIQKKNKAMVRNIEEKLRLMQMTNRGMDENKNNTEEQDLFVRIDKTIREQQLFLQPDFSRDILCQTFNINKAQCSSIFKTYANCSFPTYINRLRLNHAIELMKRYPQYSIEAIAKDCGMERANFHRRFVEEFGITPSEFKKTKL